MSSSALRRDPGASGDRTDDAAPRSPRGVPVASLPAGFVAPGDGSEPLRELFARLHADRIPYLRGWTHDAPFVVSPARDAELHRVQRLLVRLAHHLGDCYESYAHIARLDERVLAILRWASERPWHLGTFRPDYIIGTDGSIRVCEVTARFFGNGYFYSFFTDNTGRELAAAAGITDATLRMEALLAHFARMARGKDRLVLLKSSDRSDSIPLYLPFYEALGLRVEVREAHEAADFAADRRTLLLSALNQRDLLALPDDAIRRMIDADVTNDLRTVFLLHDKRFLSLVHDDGFCAGCLDAEETAFLRARVIPTYLHGRDEAVWADARIHKDAYILKHAALGKSEKVYAGPLCTDRQWADALSGGEVADMILQPFEPQRGYPAVWRGERLVERVCGAILCVDDAYFGTGIFRASTCPVTNVADDTKMAQLVTAQGDRIAGHFEL